MSPYFQQLRAIIGHDLLLLPSVAAVIRNSDGRLLLQEKASGEGWSLPAGAIEPSESPAQAVRREVLEETGLTIEPREILGALVVRSSVISTRMGMPLSTRSGIVKLKLTAVLMPSMAGSRRAEAQYLGGRSTNFSST